MTRNLEASGHAPIIFFFGCFFSKSGFLKNGGSRRDLAETMSRFVRIRKNFMWKFHFQRNSTFFFVDFSNFGDLVFFQNRNFPKFGVLSGIQPQRCPNSFESDHALWGNFNFSEIRGFFCTIFRFRQPWNGTSSLKSSFSFPKPMFR